MGSPTIQGPVRLAGGELLLDAASVAVVHDVLLIALQARRDLMTARTPADADRTRRLRDLLDACMSATTSGIGHADAADVADAAPSPSVAMTSVEEAAVMLGLSSRQVRRLLDAGDLTGDQDRPGATWRVHLDSIHVRQDRL